MNSLNAASLVNLLGFTVGVALYTLLLTMIVRHRRAKNQFSPDFLLLTTLLGLLWNIGELAVYIWNDFGSGNVPAILIAVSYSALGFLPSVVVHAVWKNSESENTDTRWLTYAAYGLSALAAFFHFQSAIFYGNAPSGLALRALTFGSLALLAGLLLASFRRKIENKAVWVAALLIFALSALHLSAPREENSWLVELVAHQSSLPLALAILVQDYRFAFADLFLKRALSLLLLSLTAFGLYVFFTAPLLALHDSHEKGDVQATAVLLTFWIGTALIYPLLHKFAVFLVDKVLLRRADYEKLRLEIARRIEKENTVETILETVSGKLAAALTARQAGWAAKSDIAINSSLVEYSAYQAEVLLPSAESPFFYINLKDFSGGRHLLSDEIELLEAVALLAARRIDAVRFINERYSREMREREFAKLAAEAQLSALRAQINPHFLFNALTTIGYLISTAPANALDTLMKLTRLLRRVLKTGGEFSTLGEEIILIESYLEIERARFEERLDVKIEVAEDLRDFKVPAFILQPLVENAVKHGISKAKNGGLIRISAELKNEKQQISVILKVFNNGASIEPEVLEKNKEKGVGLSNIEQRLRSYYGDSARLKIRSEKEKGTTAQIEIPLITSENT